MSRISLKPDFGSYVILTHFYRIYGKTFSMDGFGFGSADKNSLNY